MSAQLAVDDLLDRLTLREADQIKRELDDILDAGPKDEHAVLIATALAFKDAADMMEVDWMDALVEVIDTFPHGISEEIDG